MKARLAVATVSGKAYYLLVNELKRRKLPFLSLIPQEPIPADIKVVITTEKERHLISHPNVLVFKEDVNLASLVDEAVRTIQGKKAYEKLVIGVDPGKTFGLAVLGDGVVLETLSTSSLQETVNTVEDVIKRTPAESVNVRIGYGTPSYAKEILRLLDKSLPENVVLEMVEEAGTSRYSIEQKHRRGLRDVMSAIRIAGREGKVFPRGSTA